MSRVTDFDDVVTESRDRLLLQLYAYCGDAAAAAEALDEAFITASRQWHRVGTLDTLDQWLRERAIRRLDRRSHGPQARTSSLRNTQNTRLLTALGALDPRSRHLLVVRRLDDIDLPSAAREVGLTDGAAEQSLARSTSALHARGVDVTPSGLRTCLAALGTDLDGLVPPEARTLRHAGSRRRYAMTVLIAVIVMAVAVIAGALSAFPPTATPPATSPPPTTPVPPSTASPPAPGFDAAYLLTADEVTHAAARTGWRALATPSQAGTTSVYGDCIQAALNPPPRTVWLRDFSAAPGPSRGRLRQVLQLAPSDAEANRASRQIITGFSLCEGHQLVDYSRVSGLGDRGHLVRLRVPAPGGTRLQSLVVARSGPVVVVLLAQSPPGKSAALSPTQIVRLAGTAVDLVCSRSGGGCASPPYTITGRAPLRDETAGQFLSVVDLPVVRHVSAPWVGTEPRRVSGNPSATACDQADFDVRGATAVRSRSYVIPQAHDVPTLFGLSETAGRFPSSADARRFVTDVARRVSSCHDRQVTLTVLGASTFSSQRSSGRVWRLQQKVSKSRVLTFRVALVQRGDTVAELTFTPAGGYDVTQAEFAALARRAAIRLDD